MTEGEIAQCPLCGSAAEVHSVGELADLARMRMAQLHGQSPAAPQQGWDAQPVAGPVPGPDGRPQRGPFGRSTPSGGGVYNNNPVFDSIGDAVAGVALGAAGQFVGRAIRRRLEKTATQRVMPTISQHVETALQNQIAIAERYPGLRACMSDHVVFLAGGSRTQPIPDLSKLTMEQADALVAQLQG